MSDDQLALPDPASIATWQSLQQAAWSYARASKAKNTLRAYRADLADFTLWCKEQNKESHPATPDTICLYLTALAQAGAKVATIERRIAAISRRQPRRSVLDRRRAPR
jgi:site-specific recombinase XerD